MSAQRLALAGQSVVKSNRCGKIAAGIGSLTNGGTSRNSAKNAAFLILPPVLVARMGSRKTRWLAPAVPSLSTRPSRRSHLTVRAPVFKPEQGRKPMSPSLDAPVRPGTPADSLESHIKHLGAQMMAAYARYEASGCFSDIGEAHAYRIQMQRAIALRSPAQVRQLEIERGLS